MTHTPWMSARLVLSVVFVAALPLWSGCEEPVDAPSSANDASTGDESQDICEAEYDDFNVALLSGVCPSPYFAQYTAMLDDAVWIDDPANAIATGVDGWVLADTTQPGTLAWIPEGHHGCIACSLPSGHPCRAGGTLCFTGTTGLQCTSCSSAPATAESCQALAESCMGE